MPAEIRFYQLHKTRLEGALPQLLQRTLDKGWRAVVKAASPERVDALNQHLWTFDEHSFLPHGAQRDGDATLQPVWLTDTDENPNAAQVLMLVDGAVCDQPEAFELICTIFDGHDPEALDAARADWKRWKGSGHTLTFWKQGEDGWSRVDL